MLLFRYTSDKVLRHMAVKDKPYKHIHAVNDKRFFKKWTWRRSCCRGGPAWRNQAEEQLNLELRFGL